MAVRQRRPARRPMSARLLGAGFLLLVAFFLAALAVGARDLTMGLLAFLFLSAGVALLTYERMLNRLRQAGRAAPRNNPSPLEEFKAELRHEDEEDDEGLREKEAEEEEEDDGLGFDDLERTFRAEEPEPAPAPPPPPPPVPAPRPSPVSDSYTAAGHLDAPQPAWDTKRAFVSETSLPAASVRDVAATLVVADLTRSVDFYVGLLGLVELDRSSDAVLLEAGFGRVLLCHRDDAPVARGSLMHLALEVPDVANAFLQLQERGVIFSHPPRAAITGETYEVLAASFTDPDGHGLAITEIRER
ncbi:hypothetical protein Afil01_65880 [Actinorhabdospora filicis]|uniref:VOC domain-containing protein n=1 Tax=Actinorhabdospora filicis TaxID=1785913 RepID=A0A9W6SSQ5_9ACTN|nr:VOC family protein [Actinorhabdospora filicis]GLZ81781.1 hypothetical protein Afil01_65880 [Actinorhabdospora filicis]